MKDNAYYSRALAKIDNLNFDFSRFSMPRFVAHVGRQTGRDIIPIGWAMPRNIFGAWIADSEDAVDYIFYDDRVPLIHQQHIQLHELGHIIFGHPTLNVTSAILGHFSDPQHELWGQLRELNTINAFEEEAEMVALIIQERIQKNDIQTRAAVSSNKKAATMLRDLLGHDW